VFRCQCQDSRHSNSEQLEDAPAKQQVVWLALILESLEGSHESRQSGMDLLQRVRAGAYSKVKNGFRTYRKTAMTHLYDLAGLVALFGPGNDTQ
jgi:hypothetical protein